jgi:excinuclease ABC subunit C
LDRLGLRGKIAVIGIAKNLEEIYFPGDPFPIAHRQAQQQLAGDPAHAQRSTPLRHHAPPWQAQQAHRAHRLEEIPGIGPGTAQKLLKRFGSIKGIREA